MHILYEDNHLLVVAKPPLLPTMGVAGDADSLWARARAYLKDKYRKPGNVYLGVVSRLDRLASGVVVFARTSKAAARLTDQFRARTVEKIYWALVSPAPAANEEVWRDWLAKDERRQRMVACDQRRPGTQEALSSYRVRRRSVRHAWLEVQLETGRKHQIRVQCAAHGSPILGDRKYGASESFPLGIALHARTLVLDHPTRGERLRFSAALPDSWPQFARRIGWSGDFEGLIAD